MANDDRNVLEILKEELDFIEKGGYGRSVKTPWKATSIFQDSLSCLNYADPYRPHPCSNCHLIDFVPSEARDETVPCHHIPLNNAGETVETLDCADNQQNMEKTVKRWLQAKINEIEASQSNGQAVLNPASPGVMDRESIQ